MLKINGVEISLEKDSKSANVVNVTAKGLLYKVVLVHEEYNVIYNDLSTGLVIPKFIYTGESLKDAVDAISLH